MSAEHDLRKLLEEVRQNFTRDDDLPDGLLGRIDAAVAAQPTQPVQEREDWRNAALAEVAGCFDAALTEGLLTVLAETTDERLKDLVERRLMYAHAIAAQAGDAGEPSDGERSLTIYIDGDPIDVTQFYRAKGFEKLPPTPTMTGSEIRACGWRKQDERQMFIDHGNTGAPMRPVGTNEAVILTDGMRFFCIPHATKDQP